MTQFHLVRTDTRSEAVCTILRAADLTDLGPSGDIGGYPLYSLPPGRYLVSGFSGLVLVETRDDYGSAINILTAIEPIGTTTIEVREDGVEILPAAKGQVREIPITMARIGVTENE